MAILTDPKEVDLHAQAKSVIFNQLPKNDKTTVFYFKHLCQIWEHLTSSYHPSEAADRHRLWDKFLAFTIGKRSVRDYHTEIISLAYRLEALEQPVPYYLVRKKMLECGPDYDIIRESLETSPDLTFHEIMARFIAFDERRGLRSSGNQHPAGGRGQGGRDKGKHGNGNAAGKQPGHKPLAGDMLAAANDKEETRTCFNCGRKGHLEHDCPDIPANTRDYLKKRLSRRENHRKGKR